MTAHTQRALRSTLSVGKTLAAGIAAALTLTGCTTGTSSPAPTVTETVTAAPSPTPGQQWPVRVKKPTTQLNPQRTDGLERTQRLMAISFCVMQLDDEYSTHLDDPYKAFGATWVWTKHDEGHAEALQEINGQNVKIYCVVRNLDKFPRATVQITYDT